MIQPAVASTNQIQKPAKHHQDLQHCLELITSSNQPSYTKPLNSHNQNPNQLKTPQPKSTNQTPKTANQTPKTPPNQQTPRWLVSLPSSTLQLLAIAAGGPGLLEAFRKGSQALPSASALGRPKRKKKNTRQPGEGSRKVRLFF